MVFRCWQVSINLMVVFLQYGPLTGFWDTRLTADNSLLSWWVLEPAIYALHRLLWETAVYSFGIDKSFNFLLVLPTNIISSFSHLKRLRGENVYSRSQAPKCRYQSWTLPISWSTFNQKIQLVLMASMRPVVPNLVLGQVPKEDAMQILGVCWWRKYYKDLRRMYKLGMTSSSTWTSTLRALLVNSHSRK